MKYLVAISSLIIIGLLFFILKTYQLSVKYERFKIMEDSGNVLQLLDAKTNKIYMYVPNDNKEFYFYELPDFWNNNFNAKRYTPEELFHQD